MNARAQTFYNKRLARAIATRDRSYKLLLWIKDAVDKGLILPAQASHYSSGPDASTEWLRSNYRNIPEELRPPVDEIEEFAAFFSTYLMTSFDVVEKPGRKGEGALPQFGCRCELCLRIINASHLRPKKLYDRDKRRAEFLMVECLLQLAHENKITISELFAAQLVNDQSTRRSAAYLAYGYWLIQRLVGESDGPAILALWRLIAWDPLGGIRSGFTLELDDFRLAEDQLLAAIHSDEKGSGLLFRPGNKEN